jgi:hypothetical protein
MLATYRNGRCLLAGKGWVAKMLLSRFRVVLESVIALFAGFLGVVTVFWHDWIEALTGWDPDHHNGAFEWLIVIALLAIAAISGIAARRDWRVSVATASQE